MLSNRIESTSHSKPPFVGEKVKLCAVCTLIMGQSPASSSYNSDRNGLPFFQGNADFGDISPIATTWCTDPKKVAESGDILLSVRAPIGAINIADEKCCIGRGLAAIKPSSCNITHDYLVHLLLANRKKLEALGTGSTFKAIGKKILSDYEIVFYGTAEQNRISEQLGSAIRAIKLAEQQIELLDQLIKSRFVEMFGNCPRHVPLSSVCKFQSGKTMPKDKELTQGDVIYAKVGDLNLPGNEAAIRSSRTYLDMATAEKFLVPKGAVVFPKRGGAIGTNKKRITDEDCCLDLNLMSVIPGEKICTSFLLGWFDQMDLSDIANGSAVPQINNKDLEPLMIPLPPMNLQQQFADFVAQVDKSRFVVQQQIEKLQTLYDSLAQEYFGD